MNVFIRIAAVLGCLSASMLVNAQAHRSGQSAQVSVPENAAVEFQSLNGYRTLDSAIEQYKQLARDYSWPPVASTGVLRYGDSHPVLVDIRNRLVILGDHAVSDAMSESWLFDASLVQALVRFQRRHGLSDDGVWGPKSRAAMDIAPQKRYQQLLLNHDRQQQFSQTLGGEKTFVLVNIPAFEMRYFEAGAQVLQMRAIVGKFKAKTPLVASHIDSLELNPDWNVPSGIAHRDILPDLEASPDYLQKKGLELVVGYGSSMRVLPVSELDYERLYRGPPPQQRFWQPPGPHNPLGQLKFNFPNAYLVYLHGTPSARLFDKPGRDISSGCIRLEYPDQLARRLFGLAGPKGVERMSRLEPAIARGENRVVALPRQVAVFTSYWTAWLDEDGQVQFRDDIYQWDQNALESLSQVSPLER